MKTGVEKLFQLSSRKRRLTMGQTLDNARWGSQNLRTAFPAHLRRRCARNTVPMVFWLEPIWRRRAVVENADGSLATNYMARTNKGSGCFLSTWCYVIKKGSRTIAWQNEMSPPPPVGDAETSVPRSEVDGNEEAFISYGQTSPSFFQIPFDCEIHRKSGSVRKYSIARNHSRKRLMHPISFDNAESWFLVHGTPRKTFSLGLVTIVGEAAVRSPHCGVWKLSTLLIGRIFKRNWKFGSKDWG